jgi:hypothetical protein
MKYTVVKDGKFIGRNYNEVDDQIFAEHASRGEYVVPVEESPEPIRFDYEAGEPIYGDVDINVLKQGKLAELAENRWKEETGGYFYNGHEFHSDRESQDRFFQAFIASLNNPKFSTIWKTKTGWLDMNASDFITLYNEFQVFLQGLYQKEKALQEQVEAATTIEELEAATTIEELEAVKWQEVVLDA